jgi:hypothetical protein
MSRYTPITAIDQSSRRVTYARGLNLWQRCGRRNSRHFARTHSTVITHAVDIDRVGRRWRVYLKVNGAALIDTYVGCEALNSQISGAINISAIDIPLAGRISCQTILGNNRICRIAALRMRLPNKSEQYHHDHPEELQPGAKRRYLQ